MKKHKPNSKLPKGARKIVLRKKIIGSWVEMDFDAEFYYRGIRWLRVKDGMGGGKNREDWAADVPEVCISVHDYYWDGSDFGPNYGSFLGAITKVTKNAVCSAENDIKKMQSKAKALQKAIVILKTAA